MHIRKLLLLLFVCSFGSHIHAQDIHFSQFQMSPLTLNPAHTGKFEGTVRVGGIFRGQWASVLEAKNQYKTPSAFADAPIIRGFRKNDWVGGGLNVYTDKVGASGLVHSGGGLNAAYHLALDKKGKTVLSVGLQYGGGQRRISQDDLRFEDGYDKNGNYSASNSANHTALKAKDQQGKIEVKYKDISAGAIFSSQLNKQMDFNLGFSMGHINKPQYSLLGGGTASPGSPSTGSGARLPQRFILHGQFNLQLQPRFTVSPAFLYQTMSGNDEIILQAMAGYLFDPTREITLNFGVGYRMRDAIHPMIGGKYKSWTFGLAYDVNTSDLSQATSFRGGFELAANYIIKIYKPAVVKTKVLCPRF
jgi:type IX secretion system PorP/SprF family membrane protein